MDRRGVVLRSLPVLIACLLAVAPAAAKQRPLDVKVVNRPSSPLPVTVEPSTGDEPILIDLLAPINSPVLGSNVLPVEDVSSVCVGATPRCDAGGAPFDVPAGKVLVIETVFVLAQINIGSGPTDMVAYLNIDVPGGSIFTFNLGRADLLRPGQLFWEQIYSTTLRAPAGSRVDGDMNWLQTGAARASAKITISGRLVDAP